MHDDTAMKAYAIVFLEGFLGWSPPLWLSIDKLNSCKKANNGNATPNSPPPTTTTRWEQLQLVTRAVFLGTVFWVDLLDAVVDIALGYQTFMKGSEVIPQSSVQLGILVFVMTLLARCLAGVYGLFATAKQHRFGENEGDIDVYVIVELTIFMMEDGAAILLLASHPEDSLLTSISLWLTIVTVVLLLVRFLSTIVGFSVTDIRDHNYGCGMIVCLAACFLVPLAPPIFMMYILFQEVILKDEDAIDDDDDGFSGPLRNISIGVYAIGVLFLGGFSLAAILEIRKNLKLP